MMNPKGLNIKLDQASSDRVIIRLMEMVEKYRNEISPSKMRTILPSILPPNALSLAVGEEGEIGLVVDMEAVEESLRIASIMKDPYALLLQLAGRG
ncbi:hypothetical protein [Chromobacterium haemolyticum]|uniref:hypothetical protein n=1 Tax=Chromobacterium TaxID=535 RepID=UPI00405637B8